MRSMPGYHLCLVRRRLPPVAEQHVVLRSKVVVDVLRQRHSHADTPPRVFGAAGSRNFSSAVWQTLNRAPQEMGPLDGGPWGCRPEHSHPEQGGGQR